MKEGETKTQHEAGRQPPPNTCRPARPAPQGVKRLQFPGGSPVFRGIFFEDPAETASNLAWVPISSFKVGSNFV